MEEELRDIFGRITERFQTPLRLSGRCETKVYYHVEDLAPDELYLCAQYIAERVINVCSPLRPELLIKLPGSFTELTEMLSRELGDPEEPLEIMTMPEVEAGNGHGARLKTAKVMLVNDVITTARSCLKAHSQITMMGASVLCWSALIDRTFGPGPVPIVTAFTGEPVQIIGELP